MAKTLRTDVTDAGFCRSSSKSSPHPRAGVWQTSDLHRGSEHPVFGRGKLTLLLPRLQHAKHFSRTGIRNTIASCR